MSVINNLRGKVEFTPLGNKIKVRVVGNLQCYRNKPNAMRKSFTTTILWHQWIDIFGSKDKVNKFLKRNRKITKVIPLTLLGYDYCENFGRKSFVPTITT